ncbi:MAG: glycosyltransferase family 1 protein [Chloroherpetonaceae bacterium]|nr:glycosyltransferase family 1 protein [Chloroherpetonaceae bacterium]
MNFNHISCQSFHSGIGRYSFELALALREKNEDTFLYKLKSLPDPLAAFDWVRSIPFRSFRNLHPYLLPLFIERGIAQAQGLLHAHWFLSGLSILNRKAPKVVTMHDVSLLHIPEKNKLFESYYRSALEAFRRKQIPLIVVSESAKRDTLKFARYPEHLVHAVHNGINHHQFYPIENSRANREASGKFTLIYSGGLGVRKNLGQLLRAFFHIEKEFPEARLKIAGAFPERTDYPRLAMSLGLKNVEFTGYIPESEMNAFYNSGDLFVYPSLYEGFGFAPLEAMAAGVPVLSSFKGALSETLEHAAFPLGQSVEDAVDKMTFLIQNPSFRQTLTERGLARAKEFSWEKTAQETMKVYSQTY